MKRTLIVVAIAVVVVALTASVAIRSRSRLPPDLHADAAAVELQAEPGFAVRERSPVGRTLVQILAIRRIGSGSCEVEFTWRDTVPPAGQAAAPLRTSMALFRLRDDGQWRLTTLFKVD